MCNPWFCARFMKRKNVWTREGEIIYKDSNTFGPEQCITEQEKRIRLLEGALGQCRAVLRAIRRDYASREPTNEQALHVLERKIILCDTILEQSTVLNNPPPPPPGPPVRVIREGISVSSPMEK